jgi:putative membrane protein
MPAGELSAESLDEEPLRPAGSSWRCSVMMDWYGGMGWGGWLVACLMMIAFLALIMVVAVALTSASRGGFRLGRPTAKDVLDERLARGEIDMEEYTRTLDVLRRGEDVRRVG